MSLIDNIFTFFFFFDTSSNSKKESLTAMCLTISLNSLSKFHKENQNITIHKKVMRDTNLMTFKTELRNVNWNSINHFPEINPKYGTFFKVFSELYGKLFPLRVFQIKVKDLQAEAQWISKDWKNCQGKAKVLC